MGPSASSKKRGVAKLSIVLLRQDKESGIRHLSHVCMASFPPKIKCELQKTNGIGKECVKEVFLLSRDLVANQVSGHVAGSPHKYCTLPS